MIRLLAAVLVTIAAAAAQNAFTLSLDGAWKYTLDDRPEYASPTFDDSNWPSVSLPRYAQRPVRRSLDQVYWMRRTVRLPEAVLEMPLVLSVGIPEGFYEVYVNGQRLPGPATIDTLERARVPQANTFDLPRTGPDVVIALRLRRLSLGPSRGLPDTGPYRITSRNVAPFEEGRRELFRRHVQLSPRLWFAGALGALGMISLLFWLTYRDRWELLSFSAWSLWQAVFTPMTFLPLVEETLEFSRTGIMFRDQAGRFVSIALGSFVAMRTLGQRNILLNGLPWLVLVLFPVMPERLDPDVGLLVSGCCTLFAVGIAARKELRSRNDNRMEWLLVLVLVGMSLLQLSPFLQRLLLAPDSEIQRGEFAVGVYRIPLSMMVTLLIGLALLVLLLRRVAAERRDKMRLAAELDAARTVQQLLIPDQAGSGVEAVYLPAAEVGGDFWHLLDDRLLVVGDVSGKGLKAAMIVSLITGMLDRRHAQTPAALLAELNAALVARMDGGFVTVCVALLDGDTVTVASAGHPAPYLDGQEVAAPSGLPLGIAGEAAYAEVTLPVGGRLTFISDGVVEAANAKGELFGFERMREMSGKPAAEIAEAARAWGQNDDITVVTVQNAILRRAV